MANLTYGNRYTRCLVFSFFVFGGFRFLLGFALVVPPAAFIVSMEVSWFSL
jgi:hypothetical protein